MLVPENQFNHGRGRYCSRGCAAAVAALSRDQSGTKNPNWKGGLSVVASERKRRYKTRHPERHRAHYELTKALRNGVLRRKPCVRCGAQDVHGHHADYSRPLDVVWLCKRHHLEAHGMVA